MAAQPAAAERRYRLLRFRRTPPVSGKPWLDTEASPNNAPDGGYWNTYSKETNINTGGSYYNYSRIGRYTSAMQTDQENQTISGYQNYNGNCLASSWLQCGAYAVNGPFMTPGGLATNQNVDVNIDVLNPDAGVLWWLEFIQAQYGAWNPPPLRPLITSIAPSNGCASGGTAITIGGFNFRSGSTIIMNGVNATSVTWVNSNTLTAVTGANAPGTYNVVVKTPTLSPTTLTNGFTYAGPPLFAGPGSITPSIEGATLSWSVASGVTPFTYGVYEATNSGGEINPLLATNALSVFIPLYPGSNSPITYFFRVNAVDGYGTTDTNLVELSTQPLLDPTKSQVGDGIPNGWKQQYHLNPFDPAFAGEDPDGDGFSNLQEYLRGPIRPTAPRCSRSSPSARRVAPIP